jgi:tRNA threonylcarbamoyladenosine biosynthesis protein TsaB
MNGIVLSRGKIGTSMPDESESWLLIETSGRVGKVGLARGAAVVQAAELDASRRHARDLTAVVAKLLEAESLRAADLTGVMVGIGPGSYTGLRVGIISAKALAYATGCRLVAVPTFHAIAVQAPAEARKIWVIADALQGQIYVQRFERGAGGEVAAIDELRIDRAEDGLPKAGSEVWVTGPGVKLHADRVPKDCPLVPEADREPSVASLFAVGKSLAPASREEIIGLEPLYLRGSSAEEKAKSKV